VAARLDGAGTAVFAPPLDEELAVLPELRRVAAVSAAAALLIALALGAALAARIARPVQQLAGAAAAFGAGDLAAPIASSSIREVDQMATTFTDMRSALVARLAELRDANAALTDRNTRLTALQTDLMQRDRLVATGRLVVQLARCGRSLFEPSLDDPFRVTVGVRPRRDRPCAQLALHRVELLRRHAAEGNSRRAAVRRTR